MEVVFHIMMFVIHMKIVHPVLMNQCVHRVYNRYCCCCHCDCLKFILSKNIFQYLLEFTLHQRTQQENRKKPSVDVDSDTNADIEDVLDEMGDEDPTTTMKSNTKSTSTKSSLSKSKSKNREGMNFDLIFV
jgi:hypothetical protein